MIFQHFREETEKLEALTHFLGIHQHVQARLENFLLILGAFLQQRLETRFGFHVCEEFSLLDWTESYHLIVGFENLFEVCEINIGSEIGFAGICEGIVEFVALESLKNTKNCSTKFAQISSILP